VDFLLPSLDLVVSTFLKILYLIDKVLQKIKSRSGSNRKQKVKE